MIYAKLINNHPSYAPRCMRVGATWVYNPLPEMLEADGYMPVIETPMPEVDERHLATPHWAIQNNQIVQLWTVKEILYDDTYDKAEAYDILIGGAE